MEPFTKVLSLRVMEFAYADLADVLKAEQEENPLLLILDGLTDPHNLGSIFAHRLISATNVTGGSFLGTYSRRDTSCGQDSYGAIEHIPIAQDQSQPDPGQAQGSWLGFLGRICRGRLFISEYSISLALIIGTEGKGISSNIKKQVDEMLTIPMNGHVQSLNEPASQQPFSYMKFLEIMG